MFKKIIDKTPVSNLVFVYMAGVLLSAFLFWLMSPVNNGIVSTINKSQVVTLFDAVYFSVVTVSSLGYGDFRPVGFGRLLAVFEVIFGLVMLSLIVAKLVSERTSVHVKMLFAADVERRLDEFIHGSVKRNKDFEAAITNHDYEVIFKLSQDYKRWFTFFLNYFVYQQNVGALPDDGWLEKRMLRLLRKVVQTMDLTLRAAEAIKTDEKLNNRFKKHAERACVLSAAMANNYNDNSMKKLADVLESKKNVLELKLKSTSSHSGRKRVITESLLNRVEGLLPVKPWKKHIHKDIAMALQISNRMASEAISELEKRAEN